MFNVVERECCVMQKIFRTLSRREKRKHKRHSHRLVIPAMK